MTNSKKNVPIIGHVGIEVSNVSKSKQFYSVLFGRLGLKTIDGEFGLGFYNENFQIWIAKSQQRRVKRKAPTGEETIVTDHLAIFVKNKEEVYRIEKEMKTLGFEALFQCEEHPQFEEGYFAVSFCDPDNYIIEIYTTKHV